MIDSSTPSIGVSMPERTVISEGMEISRIVTGLWQVADMEKSGTALDVDVAAHAMIDYVADGFDTFDMADHYGSSELIASCAAKLLEEDFSSEKLTTPRIFTKWCPKPGKMTTTVIAAGIEERLERLGSSSIDLLQFHWWRYENPNYLDALRELEKFRREGVITNLGLTNFNSDHLKVVLGEGIKVATNQVSYSLIDRRASESMTTLCLDRNVQILAYGALCGGFLTDRWLGANEPESGSITDWSKMKYKRFIDQTGGWSNLQKILGALKAVAQRRGVSVANVATRWVLDQPAVGAAIVGARLTESEHRKDNGDVFSFSLDEEDRDVLEASMVDSRRLKGDCGSEYRQPPFLTASGDLSHHLDLFPSVYEVKAVPGKSDRTQILTGSKWEKICGHSRAVRIGNRILVSGTTATHGQDVIVCRGDARGQAVYILDKIKAGVTSLGGSLSDIVRTRVYLQNAQDCEAVSLVHGRYFGEVCPANATFEISQLIGDYLVEIEAEAIIEE